MKASPEEEANRARLTREVLPHLDAAYNLARHLLKDPAMAEDVVQDAVLRALRYFQGFRGDNARGWLLQIVRNTGYSALAARKAAAEESFESAVEGALPFDPPDPAMGPEAALAHADATGQLTAALDRLPPELRECLVLREMEDLSYREIARIAGVPIGTVMSRLWRARQALLQSALPEPGR